ncbi:MAG: hypothetical protein ABI649_06695 [Gaiellaceae bacterium]
MGPRALSSLAALALAFALALAAPASGAPPRTGQFVPGKSLGGVTLGMTKENVLATWGRRHGVCRSCADPTWYFNYRPFEPQGTGVVFVRNRVAHVFTVWRPTGWKTPEGLFLGASASDVSGFYGSLDKRRCTFYDALLIPDKRVTSVFYVFRDKVWGFGLIRPDASPCL